MTKNSKLIWVRYQGQPHILLRHVCLPVKAYLWAAGENKQDSHTLLYKNTWQCGHSSFQRCPQKAGHKWKEVTCEPWLFSQQIWPCVSVRLTFLQKPKVIKSYTKKHNLKHLEAIAQWLYLRRPFSTWIRLTLSVLQWFPCLSHQSNMTVSCIWTPPPPPSRMVCPQTLSLNVSYFHLSEKISANTVLSFHYCGSRILKQIISMWVCGWVGVCVHVRERERVLVLFCWTCSFFLIKLKHWQKLKAEMFYVIQFLMLKLNLIYHALKYELKLIELINVMLKKWVIIRQHSCLLGQHCKVPAGYATILLNFFFTLAAQIPPDMRLHPFYPVSTRFFSFLVPNTLLWMVEPRDRNPSTFHASVSSIFTVSPVCFSLKHRNFVLLLITYRHLSGLSSTCSLLLDYRLQRPQSIRTPPSPLLTRMLISDWMWTKGVFVFLFRDG